MYSKSSKPRPHFRKKISNKGKDRRVFSGTAATTDKINSNSVRPMRGGIRL